MNRKEERDEEHVNRAIPEGSRPVITEDNWLETIAQHPAFVWRRRDSQRNILAVARYFLDCYDYISHTSTPGNDPLIAATGIKSTTLWRIKCWLIAHGFLGMVANGRLGENTPQSSDGYSNLIDCGDEDACMADRAVFVLCLPMTEIELAADGEEQAERRKAKCFLNPWITRFSEAVDINGYPLPNSRKTNPKSIREWASPTRKSYFEAATREAAKIMAARIDIAWPLNGTTSAQDKATRDFYELQAANTVKFHAPVLNKLKNTYVARMLAPFFRADYSPADVLHSIDTKPDGTPHPHDGFRGADNPAMILQSRLNHWRMNGQPIYSRSQRSILNAKEAKERALAVAARAKEPKAPAPAKDPAHAKGIAMLRGLFN
ncbi:hypothetical protein [Pseudarthrobacter sp. PS3-L1]|uniref:hypothetical protein n=1 Tax=Pseudarthrobacter sp. PS3-L1 TaxID=3046207 RepID=UPI0024B89A37|nr:hypothetical protein [Pseudarthrobacter sp. PS3-L1]MDJ0322112.1 hypothetical protein [Pseudarthrobacter sp. PS3-L1]